MQNQEIFFKENGHKARFSAILSALGSSGDTDVEAWIDAEYGSALYILTSNPAIWERAKEYVSDSGIPFDRMLEKERFSSTEEAFIKLAANLFGFGMDASPVVLCHLGDDEDFAVMLSALRLRRSRLKFSDFN